MNRSTAIALAAVASALGDLVIALRDEEADEPAALLSIADAAKYAACSVRSLRGAIRREELPAVGDVQFEGGRRVVRNLAVKRADLLEWVERRRVAPADVDADEADIDRRVRRLAAVRPIKSDEKGAAE